MPVNPRQRLPELASARGRSLASLSAEIGRNPAYLQHFIQRGSPKRLPEIKHCHLEVDERELGARDPWTSPT